MDIHRIRVDRSFLLFATCSIIYEGRASSTCVSGDYLIIHKSDGTLLIHSGAKFNPLNYQSSGAVLKLEGNVLVSNRKKECIRITIEQIEFYHEPLDWSRNKINIFKTESDLCNSIVSNLVNILNVSQWKELHTEFQTPYGPVDIVAIDYSDTYYVIEVKRNKASLAACAQLERYLKYFAEIKLPTRGVLMSPAISKGALDYCNKHNLMWRQVNHDPIHLQTQNQPAPAKQPVDPHS